MQRWPSIRAGLIAVAIVVGLVDGCPLPPPGKEAAWQRGWAAPVIDGARRAQAFVLTPFMPLATRLRIYQRGALYQAPRADRYRLWIEGRERGAPATAWRVLFRAGDPAHQEDAELIDYARSRGAWNVVGFVPQQYPLFAQWVSERVLARHPELVSVRVGLERVRLTRASIVPSGDFVEVHVRTRGRTVP